MNDGMVKLAGSVDRREVLGGALATAFLVASGGSVGAQESPASPAAEAGYRLIPLSPEELGAPAVPEAAQSTAESPMTLVDGVAPYQNEYGTDAAPGVFPRTIRHGAGETVLEAKPERVVCLELGSIDTLFELGIVPAGIVDPAPIPFTPEQDVFLADVPRVAGWSEVDFEAILDAQADLVLADLGRDELLSDVAPTIFLFRAGSGQVWREVFAMTVLAMGEEEQGAAVVQQYEDRIRQLNAALPVPRPSISFIRVQAGSLRYMLRSNFAGRILTDLGFPRPEAQNVDDFTILNMSLETLGDYADADLVIVATDAGDEATTFANEMLESPIWQTLDAVKNDNVLLVDSATWIGGVGYGGAHKLLDDIAAHFGIS